MSLRSRARRMLVSRYRDVLRQMRVSQRSAGILNIRSTATRATNDEMLAGVSPFGLEPLEPRILLSGNPTVSSFQVNDDFQRSMVTSIAVQFSDDVSASLDTSDLILRNLDTDQAVDPSNMALSYDGATDTATFTFPGLMGTSLGNGNYTATLSASGITDGSGLTLDGNGDDRGGDDYNFDFYRLFGDSGVDRDVDNLDLIRFRQAFPKIDPDPQYNPIFDSEQDGDIDNLDLIRFRQTFPTVLAAPVSVSASLNTDTAPAGLLNNDGITFDPTITGRVAFHDQAAAVRLGLDDTPIDQYADITNLLGANGGFLLDQSQLEALLGGPISDGVHTLHLFAEDGEGGMLSTTDVTFSLNATPVTITQLSPANGEEMVNVTRETIVRFDGVIDPSGVTTDSLYLIANGLRLPGRVVVSSTNRFATFFYDQPLPASTEVRVVVDGSQIFGVEGLLIDANADTAPGGTATADFRTLPLTRIADTNVFGFVRDSYTGDPIVGATIRVDAFPEANAITDENGRFELVDMPAPEFFVHIDGSTATNAPEGFSYPNVGKPFHSVPGQTIQLEMDRETFDVFLPPVADDDMQALSSAESTDVGFGASGLAELQAMFPDVDPAVWQQMQVNFAPDAAIDDLGNPATQAVVVPVPADRIPGPLPPGLDTNLVVSILASAATNFDVPAPISFPNLDGLAPGEKQSIFSFNHDAGQWESVGLATVSADGLAIISDPGVGILAPGWHTPGPPPITPPPPPPPPPPCPLASSTEFSLLSANPMEACIERAILSRDIALANLDLRYWAAATFCLTLVNPFVIAGCLADLAVAYSFDRLAISDQFVADLEACGSSCGQQLQSAGSQDVIERPEQNQNTAVFDDALVDQIRENSNQILTLLTPYLADRSNVPQDVLDEITLIIEQTNALAEGDVATFLRQVVTDLEADLSPGDFGTDIEQPDHSVFFLAKISRSNGETFEIRGQTEPYGQYSLFVPRDAEVQNVSFFDASTNSFGMVFPFLRQDAPFTLPHPNFFSLDSASLPDLDGDGVVDGVEQVLGTDFTSIDTDNDGINDLAEIEQGLDPLDGRAFPTGIISSLPLFGEAKEVVVEGSILNTQQQTAYVATGSHGLAIVDASQFNNPIVLGQLDLSGDNVDVAIDSRLDIAAIAGGSGGLHLVDVSDPMLPTLIQTLNINAGQVEVVDGLAYVSVGSALRTYDLLTGDLAQHLPGVGANTIRSMAREGQMLYTMDASRVLRAVDISGFEMNARGSLQLPHGAGKLFVGNGIAYAGAINSYFRGGFSTADVTDPDNITLISGSDAAAPFIGPGTAIVSNGSEIGVLVGSNGGVHSLDLMDISVPADTNDFLTRVLLPAAPQSVALGAGIAFIADGTAGLQVINYLSFDNQGQAPVVTIDTPDIDVDLGTPGIQVEEGTSVPIVATITDDVQVRNAELLVNREVVRNDVSFPFDFNAVVPNLSAGSETMTIHVRATDTGGNTTTSEPLILEIKPDIFAPTVDSVSPTDGSVRGQNFRTVRVGFSESMDESTLTFDNIRLIGASNPANPLTPTDTQIRNQGRVVQFTYESLVPDDYQLVINSATVTDRAGNAIGGDDFTSSFTVAEADVAWINPDGGFWDDPANWDTGQVPLPGDDVFIGVAGDATITHRSGTTKINSLAGTNKFTLSGGVLDVAGFIKLDNEFTFSNGVLKNATISASDNGHRLEVTGLGTLDGVTLDGEAVIHDRRTLAIENGLTVNGKLYLDNNSNSSSSVS